MLKSDFYYELPEELIAQTPIEPRDSSRLMVVNRASDTIMHDYFYNIADYLNKGDLLVMNDSKVFPARIIGTRKGGTLSKSGISVEFLLLEPIEHSEQAHESIWETMVYPGRRLKKGAVVEFPEGLTAEVIETVNNGNRLVKFNYAGDFYELLNRIGSMPLPHYIANQPELKSKTDLHDRYNTVYADKVGSVAAPTAGLHFTDRVFNRLTEKGIDTAKVTLHVGIGTFRPVKCEKIEEHKMHSERFILPEETALKIRECKSGGNRVIAVGTTACRTLESCNSIGGKACSGNTDIFITPGYCFKTIDALLTNFHLPESTLLMLVSAFIGREKALFAYNEAIKARYRFFSFGDSMLIL
ncbi:MAG: tRNA preQ1(34) S-adenosylmethionine ribosyltransferase-isomerase QueA [Oscillospiraceae bacterium]|nr:tRNA preQ1(34) S-adenosylmethionine ribosyltransferase-isomerase QueA [Oscillospiraceae bacterium]